MVGTDPGLTKPQSRAAVMRVGQGMRVAGGTIGPRPMERCGEMVQRVARSRLRLRVVLHDLEA